MQKSFKSISLILLLISVLLFTGCFSSNPKDIQAFKRAYTGELTAENFILQPPDEVEIHCTRIPEIDQQHQIIRPDGKINLQSVGDIQAAGKTPKELSEHIEERVKALYSLPSDHPISVKVFANKSKVIYVLGQVYIPGPKLYTGRNTVFRAVSKAQLNPMAWKQRIQVIRPANKPGEDPSIFEVNFDKMSAHGDLTKNVLLKEGDVVYVPPTVLGGIALKVEEFVRPIGRAFSTVNVVQGNNYGD